MNIIIIFQTLFIFSSGLLIKFVLLLLIELSSRSIFSSAGLLKKFSLFLFSELHTFLICMSVNVVLPCELSITKSSET